MERSPIALVSSLCADEERTENLPFSGFNQLKEVHVSKLFPELDMKLC